MKKVELSQTAKRIANICFVKEQEDTEMEYVTLNNGIKMPKLGYGVYQTPPEDTKRCVLDAIEVGIPQHRYSAGLL